MRNGGFSLHVHLPVAAEAGEVVDVGRAEMPSVRRSRSSATPATSPSCGRCRRRTAAGRAKLVNRPTNRLRAGRSRRGYRPPLAVPRNPASPRSCTCSLKPPVLPRPVTGGAFKRDHALPASGRTPGEVRANAGAESATSRAPSLNGARMTNIAADVARVGASARREAGHVDRVSDARRVALAISPSCFTRLSGSLRLAPSGSCALTTRYPLSCSGMKPLGTNVKAETGQSHQPAIDHQHETLQPRQLGGPRAVAVASGQDTS